MNLNDRLRRNMAEKGEAAIKERHAKLKESEKRWHLVKDKWEEANEWWNSNYKKGGEEIE